MRTPDNILSATAKVELVLALALMALFLRFQDDIGTWLTPRHLPVHTSALGPCREPGEDEVLLITYVRRDSQTLRDGCTYVGSQNAYPKKKK